MISFISHTTGERIQLRLGAHLGSGLFGDVCTLTNNRGRQTQFVCKTVNLNAQSPFMQFGLNPPVDKKRRLEVTLNEIKVLEQLGLLEGYEREGDQLRVIMKLVEGVSGAQSGHPNRERLNFKALRDFHRKGFAHFDSHANNFIINADENKSTIIDFNMADESTFLNTALDTLFFHIINHPFEAMSGRFRPLLELYVEEMVQYAIAHKYETVTKVLIMGAITIAAISGVPALAVTHLMVQEFLKMLFMKQLAKEINSRVITLIPIVLYSCVSYHLGRFPDPSTLKKIETTMQIAQSCLSMYLMYSSLAYHWGENGTFINEGLNCIKNKDWYSVFANATPEVLVNTAGMYYSITGILSQVNTLVDKYVLPESALKVKADLFYKHAPLLYAKVALTKAKEAAGYDGYQVPLRAQP